MTQEEYETEAFVASLVKRFHDRTGKHPTKDEAVILLREELREYLRTPCAGWNRRVIQKRCYIRQALVELIQRINERPNDDPIRVVCEFWSCMDDMVCSSESGHTWAFAGAMRDAARDALDILE